MAGKPLVYLYTDGACSGNPGPGGWAYILRHGKTKAEKEGSGGDAQTTNNRMELSAVIQGLSALKKSCNVELYTDSRYVGQGISEWMPKWKANNWQRKQGRQNKPVKNVELWQALDKLLEQHEVNYHWVAGHSGHPENERCDELAVEAYQKYL